MKVFKFGGASIKDSAAIRNVASIVKHNTHEPLLVVISALGKTTNALEQIILQHNRGNDYRFLLNSLHEQHQQIARELLAGPETLLRQLHAIAGQIENYLYLETDPDKAYDQIVSLGEIMSSTIVSEYLSSSGLTCSWKDARQLVRTDSTFREGSVDWTETEARVKLLMPELNSGTIIITQGFIGSDGHGSPTTLGREGSDFSAAIFASCLSAGSVTIWKDVPGVMNADPKQLPAAIVFDELPYKEAAEMTYYGASVIHPKTIKPLALKGIPLYVKSFAHPDLPGTKIHECKIDHLPPVIVFKDNQCLVSCKVTDYTFVNEQQLGSIFHALSDLGIKLNVMQNSAISFTFCIDFLERKMEALIEKLQQDFEVYYNTNLTLITIKNYDEESFETYRKQPGVLLEQSSRSTLQVLVRR
jgi:aspartate kinase